MNAPLTAMAANGSDEVTEGVSKEAVTPHDLCDDEAARKGCWLSMNASPRAQKLLPDDSGVSLQGGVNISIPVSPRVQIHPLVTLNTHTHTQLDAGIL